MDVGHVFADFAFVAFGLLIGAYALKRWRMPPALPRLDETRSEAFFRGWYGPANQSLLAGSGWFISLGLFALSMDVEHSSKTRLVKDVIRIPYYLFLASAIFWGILLFVLFFTGRPRSLIAPVDRGD